MTSKENTMINKRVLQLNLTKKWFDLIKSGTKKIEYREVKKHWISRFSDIGTKVENDFSDVICFNPKIFDEIHFKNGFARDGKPAPLIVVEFEGIEIKRNITTPIGKGNFFVIHLGRVLNA